MRIVPRRLLAIAAVVVLVAAAAVLALYQATQQVPDFYRRALAAPPTAQQANGQRFEEQALVLQNQLHHAGRWEVCFTESQINGWLAAELPAKFPHALPAGVSEPRVSMEHGRLQLAIHYQRGGIDTVVSLLGQVYLTDQPNELAIQINQARAGMLPVPLGKFLQEISERAAVECGAFLDGTAGLARRARPRAGRAR